MYRYLKIFFLSLACVTLLGFIQADSDLYLKMTRGIEIFGKVYKEIAINYVDEIDPEEFMIAGIRGMLKKLDPYTVYIDKNRKREIDIITDGKYGGIGTSIGIQNGKVVVIDLIEGYSAQRQGIRIGDEIIKIDSTNISENNFSTIGKYLQKKPGSEIQLTVRRLGIEGQIIFNLITEEVTLKNLTYFGFVPKNSSNAYLKLSGFNRSAGDEVKRALKDLSREKEISAIILDLRGNPGGLLEAAIDVCEKFLDKGKTIVSVKGRKTKSEKTFISREVPIAGDLKLAVLVNKGSASASEIVAGSIQDNDRGIIVGDRSYGKGLVQTVVPLPYDNSLKITTAKYFTPSGRSIQKIDYSEKNEVFPNHSSTISIEYKTENNRSVFSKGGIKPDTIVSNSFESNKLIHLLARGMFFKFASYYFNQHDKLEIAKIDKNNIFKSFLNFISDQNFEYHSPVENSLKNFKLKIVKQNYSNKILDIINELENKILEEDKAEYNLFQNEIVNEIIIELAARQNGKKGRIVTGLKQDRQFLTALSILEKSNKYNQILAFSE